MKPHTRTKSSAPLSRRRALQVLAAAGLTGPLALELIAQSRGQISIDVLRRASVIVGEEFSPERLAVVEKALQRNLDQFQLVRELVIDDRIEPAPIFAAKATRTAEPRATTPRTRR